jgi:hypothetical protein
MTPRVKYGLIAGAVGLVLNSCISAALGICGPLVALLAGAVAGFLTVRAEDTPPQGEGARLGAISGLIAGALVFVGQLIGGVIVLALVPATGFQPIVGTLPAPSDITAQAAYWLGGMGVGVCFGMIGLAVSAGAGALAGYLATPSLAADLPPAE